MIGQDGKPLKRAEIKAAIEIYNRESRGASAFAALPRALVTILDGLTLGKTGYVKASDGQIQLTCGKDRKITGN